MKRDNLRAEIIKNSRELFEKRGYSATSVRQIANKSGCTAGSLYYFFAGGKAEILQEVINSYGVALPGGWAGGEESESLDVFIDRLIVELPTIFQIRNQQLGWLVLEIHHLAPEEQEIIRSFPVSLYDSILREINSFIDDPEISLQVCWLIFSLLSGYVDMAARIGPFVGEQMNIEEIGQVLKIAVKALATQVKEPAIL